jgi:3-dehydroquinate synthase
VSPTLVLRHPRGETPILLGEGALEEAVAPVAAWLAGRTVFLVTTPRVKDLHGGSLAALAAKAKAWRVLEVAEGEAAKTLESAQTLWREMLRAGGKRDSRVLAFGGGSVGDLAGFVASCFLRGVGFAQLPTTLLAQADAAIGGKTAIDLPEAKNSVGALHHPDWVIADSRWLETLPREQLRSGLAETIKMAALFEPDLLTRIDRDLPILISGAPRALASVVGAAARLKVGVVERDPGELGERALLNFGHTLGHALETAAGHRAADQGGLLHGDAVAWGMLFALRLSRRRGLSPVDAERLRAVLLRLDLPDLPTVSPEDLLILMARDKKAREGYTDWILLDGLGKPRIDGAVPAAEIAAELRAFLSDPWAG